MNSAHVLLEASCQPWITAPSCHSLVACQVNYDVVVNSLADRTHQL